MTRWLRSWDEPLTPGTGGHSNMSGMGAREDAQGSGMMSEEEMTTLRQATGPAFDRMFLEMMIRHHNGAIEMAEQELREGTYQPATDLATAI
jgi:uncharacterized protein (DUF305 family)